MHLQSSVLLLLHLLGVRRDHGCFITLIAVATSVSASISHSFFFKYDRSTARRGVKYNLVSISHSHSLYSPLTGDPCTFLDCELGVLAGSVGRRAE
jgi:hypothetical protein